MALTFRDNGFMPGMLLDLATCIMRLAVRGVDAKKAR